MSAEHSARSHSREMSTARKTLSTAQFVQRTSTRKKSMKTKKNKVTRLQRLRNVKIRFNLVQQLIELVE